jgi:membrane protein
MKRLSVSIRQISESLWLDELYLKRRWYIVLMRIMAIFGRGVMDNSLFNRAAALSYSSLLALAPILGIMVLISGSFLRVNPEGHIKQALVFIAPSLEQYVGEGATTSGYAAQEAQSRAEDPEIAAQRRDMQTAFDLLIKHMISGVRDNVQGISKSGKSVASIIGVGILVWMGLTLLIAIENAMNGIWGVKRGRAWGRKFVLYWTVLSLGILASVALVGLTSTTTLTKVFKAAPVGARLAGASTSVLSLVALALVLTLFYKLFPNTRVRFLPALVGGLVAALLLVTNNVLSMMYIRSVVSIQSLYGSVGVLLVMMLGLYLFWAFLLLGAQLTYAVQNAQFLADQKAWKNASERTRETITFAAFIMISRRFSRCQPPLSADELAEVLRVPANILNECLGRLCEMGFATAMEMGMDKSDPDRICFIPARPLKSITFAGFRAGYAALGADRGVAQLRSVDPLVDLYRVRMEEASAAIPAESIEELLERTDANLPAG